MTATKNKLLLVSFCSGIILLICSPKSHGQQSSDHVAGDVIVMLKKEVDVNKIVTSLSTLNGEMSDLKTDRLLSKSLGIWLLHFDQSKVDENKMLGAFQRNDGVLFAQFNHYVELRSTPNDANFASQWNMLNIGQIVGSIPGADIKATSAWDITTGGLTAGGDTIVVAIDDAGFDTTHQDLNFWRNYQDHPHNSIDEDGNGYVDDYYGWNALTNTGDITSDTHGTHVAGIAGAKGNNNVGVAGVNWNVQIMPVKGYSGTESVVVIGYTYILEMRKLYNETNGAQGAFVVSANSSFGINGPLGNPSAYPIWCAMYDSMGKYGILNSAATANTPSDIDVISDIPTGCPSDYMISVTNTTYTDQKYSSAAYGLTTIDLGAPGYNIYSTYPGNLYSTATGTSSASPHLAGAVALLYSLPCEELVSDFKNDPAGAALRIKGFILDGVDEIPDLQGKTVSGGRLNIYKAILLAGEYYHCNVGIGDVTSSNHEVVVWPNPASDILNVLLKNKQAESATLRIKNVLGQELLSETIGAQGGQLNVAGLAEGIYFLSISVGEEHDVIRWIKN